MQRQIDLAKELQGIAAESRAIWAEHRAEQDPARREDLRQRHLAVQVAWDIVYAEYNSRFTAQAAAIRAAMPR